MLVNNHPAILLASPEPALLAAVEPVLLAMGVRVEVVLSAQAALGSMKAATPPGVALLDARLPGMSTGQLLAAMRAETVSRRFPIVLISDTVTEEWTNRLAEGVIDDLILRGDETA
jgi:CheY-like chemotaxis protein